jgi:hypothetical protein
MKFEEEFPKEFPSLCELSDKGFYEYILTHLGYGEYSSAEKGETLDVVTSEGIQKHCLDKQKVRDAILKVKHKYEFQQWYVEDLLDELEKELNLGDE